MQQKRTRLFLFSLLAASSLFFLVESGILPGIDRNSDSSKNFRILGTALSLIRDDYVEKPNPAQTMEGAYKGLVNSLDRMSGYLSPKTAGVYLENRKQPLPEAGIILYKRYGAFPVITGVREGSPAEEHGLKIGDSIGAIEDESTLHMSMLEANLKLKSIAPRTLRIKLIQAEENREITLKTRILPQQAFVFQPEPGTSGILKIRNFSHQALSQFKKIQVPQLSGAGLPLVLDLRNCFQGDYDTAAAFLNIFIQGDEIGEWKTQQTAGEKLSCPAEPVLGQIPLIVWTNQATAGPAEILVRALQDTERTSSVIGLPTPGLTARSEFFLFDDQSGIVLTASIFHPLDSPPLWEKGIRPDIRLELDKLSLDAFLEATLKTTSLDE